MVTGLIAGTMDITAACIQFAVKTGKSPVLVLQYISSAIFSKEEAYSGSMVYPVLGLLFHYLIAFIWSAIFYFIYPRVGLQKINKFFLAIVYGIFVWVCMNRIVVPSSRIPAVPFNLNNAIQAAAILIICIGLPISLRVSKYNSSKNLK